MKKTTERVIVVLKKLEWSDDGCCPECGVRNEDMWDGDKPVPRPHDPNCEVGKLLHGDVPRICDGSGRSAEELLNEIKKAVPVRLSPGEVNEMERSIEKAKKHRRNPHAMGQFGVFAIEMSEELIKEVRALWKERAK